MKSIDVKSLLIGFLLCTTFFLSVGATDNSSMGKYQGFGIGNQRSMLNTHTGEMFVWQWEQRGKSYWKQSVKPNTFTLK